MTPARKRAYLALIGVGGVGLAIDRLWPPAPTQAELLVPSSGPRTTATSPSAADSGSPTASNALLAVPELHFPRGLPDWNPDDSMRDLFASDGDKGDSLSRDRGQAAGFGTCADLTENSRLDAVMVNDQWKIAIINGERIQVGGDRLGCELFSVEGHRVRFRCKDGEAAITLKPTSANP